MADVNLTGRLGRDVATFNNENGSRTHILNIARPRNYADADGNYGVDFVQVKAFTNSEKAHAFYANNMKKGTLVQMSGDFSSGKYKKDGETVYTVDIIVDNINPFLERRSSRTQRQNEQAQQPAQQVAQQAVQQPMQQPAQQQAQNYMPPFEATPVYNPQ